jgi:hypothetical protein
MKTPAVVLLVVLSIQLGQAQHHDFRWLTGTWKLKNKAAFEVWHVNADGDLSGKAFRIHGVDTIVTEVIKLEYSHGSFHYIPDVAGDQLPVDFIITKADSQSFVAENPQHDFPKIIRYRCSTEGSRPVIEASIEGNGKVISYSFEKVK